MDRLDKSENSRALQRVREEIVHKHIEAEQRGDWLAALDTFTRARYEVTPTNEIIDGRAAVLGFYNESTCAFPDMTLETRGLYPAGSTIVHEVILRGTHQGMWRGLPPTGKTVDYSMLNLFLFEEDRLVCERMYFDLLTPMRQLGIARDPTSALGQIAIAVTHPLTIGSAFVRHAMRRSK